MKDTLKNIKCFVFDMDGTIYDKDSLFPGSIDLLKYLEKNEIEYFFLTNNSSKTGYSYYKKLKNLGITFVKKNQIITASDITIKYLIENNLRSIYLVGTPEFEHQCVKSNIKVVKNKNENIEAVVVGFDTTFTYKKGEIATYYLRKNKEIKFISTSEDLACPIGNNEFIPDCGAITSLIEKASNRQAKYLGKPRKETVNYLLDFIKVKKEELAIVGDRLYTDIAIGFYNNFTSIALLTGEFKKKDLESSKIKPSFIFKSIKELYNYLSQTNQRG